MKNLNEDFTSLHKPVKAVMIYKSNKDDNDFYVEAFDVNKTGRLVDPHPLSVIESQQLAQSLLATDRLSHHFLQPQGLIPQQVLYTRSGQNGFAVWYTPPTRRRLQFTNALGLTDGSYALPALLWKADRESLSVYGLKHSTKPSLSSKLFHAPFFNIYDSGNVCMGTVDIEIDRNTFLESFISQWEEYFFESKFSHTLGNSAPVEGNIIQLWQSLCENENKFPVEVLKKHHTTIKNLIA
jgi:PRTRC genetic system protein B